MVEEIDQFNRKCIYEPTSVSCPVLSGAEGTQVKTGMITDRGFRGKCLNSHKHKMTKLKTKKLNYPATRPTLFEMTFCSVLLPKNHQMAQRFKWERLGYYGTYSHYFRTFLPCQRVWISMCSRFRVLSSVGVMSCFILIVCLKLEVANGNLK